MHKISLEEREISFKREMKHKNRMEPITAEVECPRCSRTHSSFVEEIGGSLFDICDTCMTIEEKEIQDAFSRGKISDKYLDN